MSIYRVKYTAWTDVEAESEEDAISFVLNATGEELAEMDFFDNITTEEIE